MKGDASDCGLIPMAFKKLFEGESKSKRIISVKMSYYEVYNEMINDLLDSNKQNLDIREDKDSGVFVKDLTLVEITDYKSAMASLYS